MNLYDETQEYTYRNARNLKVANSAICHTQKFCLTIHDMLPLSFIIFLSNKRFTEHLRKQFAKIRCWQIGRMKFDYFP